MKKMGYKNTHICAHWLPAGNMWPSSGKKGKMAKNTNMLCTKGQVFKGLYEESNKIPLDIPLQRC